MRCSLFVRNAETSVSNRIGDACFTPQVDLLRLGIFLATTLALTCVKAGEIRSGRTTLEIDHAGIRLLKGSERFASETPIDLQLAEGNDLATALRGAYRSIRGSDGQLVCTATLTSSSQAVFSVRDVYSSGPHPNTFRLSREVTVLRGGNEDGFQSRFRLASSSGFAQHEYFVPGIWYRDNSKARPGALGTSKTDEQFLIREDRMPIPMAMMRDRNSGVALSLVHLDPDGATCQADTTANRVIDARIQVAALGFAGQEQTAVTIAYPATEGSKTYLRSGNGQTGAGQRPRRMVERFHPIREGFSHRYSVLIHLQSSADFPEAMRAAWRVAFREVQAPIEQVDLEAVYEASIALLSDRMQDVDGAAGIPFRLALPEGRLERAEFLTYQMGFVGQQLPIAYHLLRYGLVNNDPKLIDQGESMMKFWVENSPTDAGLPRVWFNTWPQPHWRQYDTYLRIASDGMSGALMAWDIMKRYGHDRPNWLRFCQDFGDWLVKHQHQDGSWARAYRWDGSISHQGKLNTSHPVRFLIDLHHATGEQKYLDAATRAGDFCWIHIHQAFAYVGGTPDNPNVLDKEAGLMAIEAFLALWDASGEPRYLDAAAQAADFVETWAYCWNVPLPSDDPELLFPASLPTSGFSLIATGHSGADLYLAGSPFLFYRIYLGTGDPHYAQMAQLLLHNTRRHVDLGGSLGYGQPGLCTEALNLSVDHGRGRGVDVWLPWLSYQMIEPIVRLRDVYGHADTPLLNDRGFLEMQSKDRQFAQNRGLGR